MDLTVYWTRLAENKLGDIFDFYEMNVSSHTAQKLVNGIIDKTVGLNKNPYIGQEEELLSGRPQNFRYLIYKNYKIIYWINKIKNRIDIVNVFDTRQNPTEINNFV